MTEIKENNNSPRYILACFEGFDWKWLSDQPINCNDEYFECVQFLKDNQIKLTIRPDIQETSYDVLKRKARMFFFILYILYIKKNKSAPAPFDFDIIEIQNQNGKQINLEDYICVKDSGEISRCHSDGSVVTAEEFEKEQSKIERENMEYIIQGMPKDRVYSSLTSPQEGLSPNNLMLMKLILQVKDDVIRYCMLYDWLYSFFGNHQGNTSSFIKTTAMFDELKQSGNLLPLVRERYNSKSGKKEKEDIFTYYRNLVGHSTADILAFSEREVLGYIQHLNWPLFRIILEKMEKDANEKLQNRK